MQIRKTMKVLFIIKQRSNTYGVSVGLQNSARFVANALAGVGVDVKVANVVDGNCIDREVYRYRPTHVIIEALWVTPDKIAEIARLHRKVIFNIRIHSKTPFLANEGMAFQWINGYKNIARLHKNVRISSNNYEYNEDMTEVTNFPFDFLPNIYQPNLQVKKHIKQRSEFIDIGCFGAIRPLKNHLEQAVAAIKFGNILGKKVRFHINASRVEQRGEEVLKNLRSLFEGSSGHKLVEHAWMPHTEFVSLIGSMDINMQVSMSESFNIVTADSILTNVPVVVSVDMDWVPFLYRAVPTDTDSIVNKLRLAWFTRYLTFINKWALDRYNRRSLRVWLRYLYSTKVRTV
jgi:hypothetical protein